MAGNEEWTLAAYPIGRAPEPADFQKRACPVPTPGPGQVLVKTLCLSVDPYLRIKLYPQKDGAPEAEDDGGEFAPFKLNEPLSSMFVGEVVAAGEGVAAFKPGDRVSGVGPWARFAALDAATLQPVPSDLPPSAYLNVLGLIGLSTYFPLVEIGEPKAGETVFVSGGAGAVGSLVGQLCKAFGCKVIASTGSDNKVEALRGLGFDEVFNYKTVDVAAALDKAAPEGIDVYWDNVGGPTLDAVLPRMKRKGRIVACGAISQYHVLGSEKTYGLKQYMSVVTSTIKWQGFLAFDYVQRAPELFAKLGAFLKQGKIKPLETLHDGLDEVPAAFMGLFKGENLGKMLIKVADPSTPTGANTSATAADAAVAASTKPTSSALAPKRLQLQRDIGEARELLALAMAGGRPHAALTQLLSSLERELAAMDAPPAAPTTAASAPAAKAFVAGSAAAEDLLGGTKYEAVDSFGWDQGEYNCPWVSVYVTLEGVGDVKDQVTCTFTKSSFDLKVHGLQGKNYRLVKDTLDKDIVPGESKWRVKGNRVTVQLKKVKGEFGYDHWADLTARRGQRSSDTAGAGAGGAGEDPMGGIMDLMKQMYEEGDDTMRKTIAESMMKVQRGDRSGSGLPQFDRAGYGGGLGGGDEEEDAFGL